MKKTNYIFLIIILFYSCKEKCILSTIPKLNELNLQSSLADEDLANSIINYQQYLQIKSIQNWINHGTIHYANGLSYKHLLDLVSKYAEGEGFISTAYEGKNIVQFEIDTTYIDDHNLNINISLSSETNEQIYIDELIVIVEDIFNRQMKVFVYNCPLEISNDEMITFGSTISKIEIIESFNRKNFKIEVQEQLYKSLNLKAYANRLKDKSKDETWNSEYYEEPKCILSDIVSKYDPEEEIKKYSKNDTLKKTVFYLDKFTCK